MFQLQVKYSFFRDISQLRLKTFSRCCHILPLVTVAPGITCLVPSSLMDCEPCQSCLSCSLLKTQCPVKNLSYSQYSLNIRDTKGFHSWGSFLRGTFPSCPWVLARENCAISILSSLHESEAQWVFVEWLNNWIAEWVMEERDKWLWGTTMWRGNWSTAYISQILTWGQVLWENTRSKDMFPFLSEAW